MLILEILMSREAGLVGGFGRGWLPVPGEEEGRQVPVQIKH